jgi:hypothetical protein
VNHEVNWQRPMGKRERERESVCVCSRVVWHSKYLREGGRPLSVASPTKVFFDWRVCVCVCVWGGERRERNKQGREGAVEEGVYVVCVCGGGGTWSLDTRRGSVGTVRPAPNSATRSTPHSEKLGPVKRRAGSHLSIRCGKYTFCRMCLVLCRIHMSRMYPTARPDPIVAPCSMRKATTEYCCVRNQRSVKTCCTEDRLWVLKMRSPVECSPLYRTIIQRVHCLSLSLYCQ